MDFLLALTIGLLAFLLVDTVEDALELADEAAPIFQGADHGRARGGRELPAPAVRSAVATAPRPASRWRPTSRSGIGLHNLGEGLAIGAAFAAGAAGLGTFLVLGFTLHNVTEGIGIAAPMLKAKPTLSTFAGARAAGRRPRRPRHLARQPRLRAALVGPGAGDRCGRHFAGHRRSHELSAARRGRRGAFAPRAECRGPRDGCHPDVRDGHAREDLSPGFGGRSPQKGLDIVVRYSAHPAFSTRC